MHPGTVVIIVNILDIESVMMLKAGGGVSLSSDLNKFQQLKTQFCLCTFISFSLRQSGLTER